VVSASKFKKVEDLIEQIRLFGHQLVHASPCELVVGNIVRRVLGLIREVIEPEGQGDTSGVATPMVGLLSSTEPRYPVHGDTNGDSVVLAGPVSMRDVREDVLNGLREMLDEIDQADEQIAGYALEHIHPQEIIMTYSSSLTIQKFLLAAAKRRKFTVIHVEGYPNLHEDTYETIVSGRNKTDEDNLENDSRLKALTAAGITVIIIPDSAVFALMSKVHKVIMPTHSVLANGGFTSQAGSKIIAQAAKAHRVPLIALGAVFKLSPTYPFDIEALIEVGNAGNVLDYRDGDLVDKVETSNPTLDYVPPEMTALFISNM
jgi:translation initiation factor eIF-2B subunit beta